MGLICFSIHVHNSNLKFLKFPAKLNLSFVFCYVFFLVVDDNLFIVVFRLIERRARALVCDVFQASMETWERGRERESSDLEYIETMATTNHDLGLIKGVLIVTSILAICLSSQKVKNDKNETWLSKWRRRNLSYGFMCFNRFKNGYFELSFDFWYDNVVALKIARL